MRLAFAFVLSIFLGACAPPVPPAEPIAPDLPPDLASYSQPIGGEPAKEWCYEVGNAPAHVKPLCKPSPEACESALAEARRVGVEEGFGDPFSECRPLSINDMTRPHRLSGKAPVFSHAAREAGAHGTVLVRCKLTALGYLEGCRIVRSVPLMDQAVLEATTTWRYEPARFLGRAISTTFTIPIRVSP